jgi:transposase-like protein
MTSISEKTKTFEGQSNAAVLHHLNHRLRELGKPELKVWKASREKLIERIVQTDPDTAFAPAPEPAPAPAAKEKDNGIGGIDDQPQSLADSAMAQNVAKPAKPKKPTKTVHPAHLARGLETELYARNCRDRVRDIREKERAAAKSTKPAKGDKKTTAPKVAAAPKANVEANPNYVTVADIARELGVNPKVARNKLRRRGSSLPEAVTGASAWTFHKKDRALLVEMLSN